MQSLLNLPGNSGLPLCLSGITHPLTLSREMADHDLRRKAMKKQKRRILDANHDLGIVRNHEREIGVIREGEIDGDLAGLLNDLIYMILACPAKAA
ncbi:uncharacterized protein LOC130766750 [Actinidia eriantha]|uniref:uncharacterized protein LOC130766750 n=1 Tax=Actinidia eriantha TaxID=165200 RepID=UPI00258C3A1E|nr:uncharacterized protein LOC130766750 [Actinidia eriantha]